MSNYRQIARHPQTGIYEVAEYLDDYYGSHLYGVEFPSEGKVYPEPMVEQKQIYDFWRDDVVNAYKKIVGEVTIEEEVKFLNEIQHQYTKRWEDDPITGNGATKKSRVTK